MRTTGSILKEAREKQKKTILQVARQTRIKERFLEALENSDWPSLPNFTVAHGFARNYAVAVGANTSLIVALLRRDFPKHQTATGKVEIPLRRTSIWTPTTTIFVTVVIALFAIGGYLAREYLQFSAPPPLSLNKLEVSSLTVTISGKTISSATVQINGQPVLVDSDGSFKLKIDKKDLINSLVEVEAESRTGKKTFLKQVVD